MSVRGAVCCECACLTGLVGQWLVGWLAGWSLDRRVSECAWCCLLRVCLPHRLGWSMVGWLVGRLVVRQASE